MTESEEKRKEFERLKSEEECNLQSTPLLVECSQNYKKGLEELNMNLHELFKKVNDLDKLLDDEAINFEDDKVQTPESLHHDYKINNENLFKQNAKLRILMDKMNKLI